MGFCCFGGAASLTASSSCKVVRFSTRSTRSTVCSTIFDCFSDGRFGISALTVAVVVGFLPTIGGFTSSLPLAAGRDGGGAGACSCAGGAAIRWEAGAAGASVRAGTRSFFGSTLGSRLVTIRGAGVSRSLMRCSISGKSVSRDPINGDFAGSNRDRARGRTDGGESVRIARLRR